VVSISTHGQHRGLVITDLRSPLFPTTVAPSRCPLQITSPTSLTPLKKIEADLGAYTSGGCAYRACAHLPAAALPALCTLTGLTASAAFAFIPDLYVAELLYCLLCSISL
jgi:hypothetical protein